MTNRPILVLLAAIGAEFINVSARADAVADRLEKLRPALAQLCSVPVAQWRYHQPDVPDGEQPNLDGQAPGRAWRRDFRGRAKTPRFGFDPPLRFPAKWRGIPWMAFPFALTWASMMTVNCM